MSQQERPRQIPLSSFGDSVRIDQASGRLVGLPPDLPEGTEIINDLDMEQEYFPGEEDVILDTNDAPHGETGLKVTDLRTGDEINITRGKAIIRGALVRIVDSTTGNETFIPSEYIRIDRKRR